MLVVCEDALRITVEDAFLDVGFDKESSEEGDGAKNAYPFEDFGVSCRFGGLDDCLSAIMQTSSVFRDLFICPCPGRESP